MALSKPSSTDPVYTPGMARGAKLAALLVDQGTLLVRKILEDEVQNMSPPSLREQLKNHRRYLTRLRYLNLGQRKTLYPDNGLVPDTAQGFDISLLELLLKELVMLELGRDAPHPGERDRLRRFRNNNYGHISSTELSEGDFDRLWKELTEILISLGGDGDKISERLNSCIDPEQEAEYFTSLEKLHKEDMEVKEILLAQVESQEKGQREILDQGKSLKLGQEELKRLLEEVRIQESRARGTGTDAGQHEDWSSTTGLSDAVDDVIACLKDLYATEYAHVRPLPWCEDFNLHLGEVYTSLQLQQKDDRGHFQDTDTILSLAGIYKVTEGKDSPVHVRSDVRKVRVEGDPGIGKSCSCQKLAYDWSNGKLDRFKIVFFLEMRHLAGKVNNAIFEQLLPKDTKITPDQLWSYIQENQDDVLFILDGLDELSEAAREVTDVVDLIQGKIVRNCHVLVTSRPYHCVKDLEKCHQFYRIVGYNKENSEEFIHKYFCQSPESASKLVEQFHSNINLSEIVVNPLNNVLICVVWEDSNNELPSNKAELYEMIMLSVAKRFCTKKTLPLEGDQLPLNIQEALRGLEKLSWEGLEQEQLQFNLSEITKKYDMNASNMLDMGLLTRDYSFSRIKRTCYCAFLHKTFQEYMAARYISGLVKDGSSREEGMNCLRSLFGFTKASNIDKELISNSRRRYREVQNWLPLILGENTDPLFDMFAEELSKAQTDDDREVLTFVCIIWLGKTCAGARMAEIVVPYLSQHITNNLPDYRPSLPSIFNYKYDADTRDTEWFVGLTPVLTCQKKLAAKSNPRLTEHLTINFSNIGADSLQDELVMLQNILSYYDAIRSVTLIETVNCGRAINYAFSPLHTFVPRCGTNSVSIHINQAVSSHTSHLSLFVSLEQLSEVPRVEHVRITVGCISSVMEGCDADFSEYDMLLAQMIRSQSSLKSIRLWIGQWSRDDPKTGNLTATLQSISEHTKLEVAEFGLPRNDSGTVKATDTRFAKNKRPEILDIELAVHELTECIKKNKVLKTLRVMWALKATRTNEVYEGVCSSQSLSRLCSAIQRNQTLETLVIEGMFCELGGHQDIIDELMRNKPSNYKELVVTMVNPMFRFPAAWVSL